MRISSCRHLFSALFIASSLWATQVSAAPLGVGACNFFSTILNNSLCEEYGGTYEYEGSETTLLLTSTDPHNTGDGGITDHNEVLLALDRIDAVLVGGEPSVTPTKITGETDFTPISNAIVGAGCSEGGECGRGEVYWMFDGSSLLAFDWDIVKIGIKAANEHYYFYLDPFAGAESDSRDTVLAGVFNWETLTNSYELPKQGVSHIDLFGTPNTTTTTTAPEPATTALLALGLLGVGAAARRRRLN